jgi:hypothetical protein
MSRHSHAASTYAVHNRSYSGHCIQGFDANDVGSESIRLQVACPEYVRLLQHYAAALRRWEQAELVSKKTRLAAEIKDKAQNERDAAKMRLNLHKRSCPVCLNLTSRSD